MPMYRDPDRQCEKVVRPQAPRSPSPQSTPLTRQLSQGSVRLDLCDGPIVDEPIQNDVGKSVDSNSSDVGGFQDEHPQSRNSLIQRLKREQSPKWVPARQTEPLPQSKDEYTISHKSPPKPSAPLLLPAIELKNIGSARDGANNSSSEIRRLSGYEIERPRSALHAGNFTTDCKQNSGQDLRSSPEVDIELDRLDSPFIQPAATPPEKLSHARRISLQTPDVPFTGAAPINTGNRTTRSRAPSLQSYSSSFVLKAPTSPLVQQANNEDLDFSPVDMPMNLTKENRRHTLPPHSLQSLRPFNSGLAQAARQPAALQREDTYPLNKSQQKRRSLGSTFPYQHPSSPPVPNFLRSRRTSFSGDASPLQPSSMVGSYEESILRGRMSGTPSKPLEFTAQIGALGRGDCRPKHPTHVSVQFPAVFYSWNHNSSAPNPIDDEPSPYVGQIDIEHNVPPPQRKEKRKRRKEPMQLDEQDELSEPPTRQAAAARATQRRRRSPSPPKLPVGGCYRIPQEGHLQILIKNPNKTAVKLFLVPYDLHGMPPGHKTFVRQKCYSAGPVIENPITSKSETAIDSKTVLNDPKSKPTLRYLIHVQICSPAKGRFYLYKNISVVFANRVPDNKENLKNEIRLPEPRYSPWKPTADPPTPSLGTSAREARRSLEKSMRRRSDGFGANITSQSFDASQGLNFARGLSFPGPQGYDASIPPVPAIPSAFTTPSRSSPPASTATQSSTRHPTIRGGLVDLNDHSPEAMDLDTPSKIRSPASPKGTRFPSVLSPILSGGSVRSSSSGNSNGNSNGNGNDSYNKLSRGDLGYGGLFGRPGTPEPGEGLLARKLRGLDVEQKEGDE